MSVEADKQEYGRNATLATYQYPDEDDNSILPPVVRTSFKISFRKTRAILVAETGVVVRCSSEVLIAAPPLEFFHNRIEHGILASLPPQHVVCMRDRLEASASDCRRQVATVHRIWMVNAHQLVVFRSCMATDKSADGRIISSNVP